MKPRLNCLFRDIATADDGFRGLIRLQDDHNHGKVLPFGTFVTTSAIFMIDFELGLMETRNTLYLFNPTFVFPESRVELFKLKTECEFSDFIATPQGFDALIRVNGQAQRVPIRSVNFKTGVLVSRDSVFTFNHPCFTS